MSVRARAADVQAWLEPRADEMAAAAGAGS
jgi:hypothetical protein